MSTKRAEDPAVFHRERGVRIFNGVIAALLAYATVVMLIDLLGEPDPIGFGFVVAFGGLAIWCVRIVVSRLIVDRRGLEIVDVLRRRHYAWPEVDRFEVSKWRRRAVMVLRTGKTVPLLGYRVSPAEGIMGRGSPTERLVEDLNALRPGGPNHRERPGS